MSVSRPPKHSVPAYNIPLTIFMEIQGSPGLVLSTKLAICQALLSSVTHYLSLHPRIQAKSLGAIFSLILLESAINSFSFCNTSQIPPHLLVPSVSHQLLWKRAAISCIQVTTHIALGLQRRKAGHDVLPGSASDSPRAFQCSC